MRVTHVHTADHIILSTLILFIGQFYSYNKQPLTYREEYTCNVTALVTAFAINVYRLGGYHYRSVVPGRGSVR
jgi:hypothetical protein